MVKRVLSLLLSADHGTTQSCVLSGLDTESHEKLRCRQDTEGPCMHAGNWQWLSCSRFFYQYFRVYSPISFGQKYDKNGDFIRHFFPELQDFPAKYIYEPWTAPVDIQRKAKCIIGVDYPKPIVDHLSLIHI